MKFLIGLSVLALCMACKSNVFFSNSTDVKGSWSASEILEYKIDITDTLSNYNAYFILRNDNKYPYQNINLFTKIADEKSDLLSDTLSYVIAEKDGKWLGKGLGSIKENMLVLQEKFKFPKAGTYTFNIQHGMRKDPLPGIQDFSLIIEKVNYETE